MSKLKRRIVALFSRLKAINLVRSFVYNKRASSSGTAGYIIGVVLALYITAYTIPEAIVALTNQTSWAGAPTAVITLGTTVLAIIVILGIAIRFMPREIKAKMGI